MINSYCNVQDVAKDMSITMGDASEACHDGCKCKE
jgi:hypothetical protein